MGERVMTGTARPRRSFLNTRQLSLWGASFLLIGLTFLGSPQRGWAQQAETEDTPRLSFDGFGSLGVVHSTEEQADFLWNALKPEGPGASGELSLDVDSRLGGQVSFQATPKFKLVVQAIAEQNEEDAYTPHLEWAYAEYKIAPSFSVRAGKTPLPLFQASEFRKVSYANPWVRPPIELYGIAPLFSSTGLSFRHRMHFEEWTNTTQLSYGHSDVDFPGGTIHVDNLWNVNNVLRHGGWQIRAGGGTGVLTSHDLNQLFDAYRQFGPEGREIAEQYELNDTPVEYLTAGAEYNPGPWFGGAELGWFDMNSVLGEKLGGYVSGGYRFGPVLSYLSYSRVEALHDTQVSGLSTAGLPPQLTQQVGQLNQQLNAFLQTTPVQQNLGLGGRWNVTPGIAVKGQVNFIDMLEQSPGTFGNLQPGFEPGGSAQVLSLATTFVF